MLGSPPHNGILSQLILDPHCLASEDTTSTTCTPLPVSDVISPCGASLQTPADASYNNITYGLPGSLWIHSQAKNCAGTVSMILASISAGSSSSPTVTATTGPATTSAAPATPPIRPGHESPQDAVDGFYQAELAGDWAAVCSYIDPADQALCQAGTSGQGAATGQVTVVTSVSSGGQALVSVTGRICAPSTPCVSNSDPTTGMPRTPSQFANDYATALANATSTSTTVMSPVPCTNVNSEWYVAFG